MGQYECTFTDQEEYESPRNVGCEECEEERGEEGQVEEGTGSGFVSPG